jgi:hypothetical protein
MTRTHMGLQSTCHRRSGLKDDSHCCSINSPHWSLLEQKPDLGVNPSTIQSVLSSVFGGAEHERAADGKTASVRRSRQWPWQCRPSRPHRCHARETLISERPLMCSATMVLGFRWEVATVPWRCSKCDVLHPHVIVSVWVEHQGLLNGCGMTVGFTGGRADVVHPLASEDAVTRRPPVGFTGSSSPRFGQRWPKPAWVFQITQGVTLHHAIQLWWI